MKRVYCLYRVSSTMQVEHDDIPMQKEACRKYVSNITDWKIEREYLEKGVSGYKVSAADRDAIQKIRDAALKSEFDILLVYMFDRLGRRDDETPFLVEWFVRHNIEVWSAMEGQQRFDSHIDKLLNYIRFWQASGESQKLSMRITTKLAQMAEDGIYRGGYIPYGYILQKQGRVNRKGHDVHDMIIKEDEAAIVRAIFHKIGMEGYSSGSVAIYLNSIGIPTRRLAMFWRASSIRSIVKNPIYNGYIRHGGKLHGPFEIYRIVSDELFAQVQQNVERRRTIGKPFCTENTSLLAGILTCGSCGEKLAANHYMDKRYDSKTLRSYYRCYGRINCHSLCVGQTAYNMQRVDRAVQMATSLVIGSASKKAMLQVWRRIHETMRRVHAEQKSILEKALTTAQREEKLLHNALVDALIGENTLSTEVINERLEKQAWKIKNIKAELIQIDKEFVNDRNKAEDLAQSQGQEDELFNRADEITKRAIFELLIQKIVVTSGYKIDIFFACSEKELNSIRR